MDNKKPRLALIGLPESGKTTFIAAFYHSIQDIVEPTPLQLTELPEESAYLDLIVDAWRRLKPMQHTKDGTFEDILFQLKNVADDTECELYFPDVSGEDFNEQWEGRICRPAYRELVSDINGLLLFVHPNVVKPVTIVESKLVSKKPIKSDGVDADKPYEPKSAPTGIKLVELLQIVKHFLPKGRAIRISVVISAWDIEMRMRKPTRIDEPIKWLEARIPLLHQYLSANGDWLVFDVFGISAQGGDLARDKAKLEKVSASGKIIVKHGNAEPTNDITLPIRWALAN